MILSPINNINNLSIFGSGFFTETGVSAARGVAMSTSLAAFSKTINNLRKTTPTTKLPSYVLGFVFILIAAAVTATAIFFKSDLILLDLIYATAPRGISVLSAICMVSSTCFVISRMVYEIQRKRRPLKLLSQKLCCLFSFNTCSEN